MAVTIRYPQRSLRRPRGAVPAKYRLTPRPSSDALKALNAQHAGFDERLFDDKGEPSPLRERVRRRRRHPLHAGHRHAPRRRHNREHHPPPSRAASALISGADPEARTVYQDARAIEGPVGRSPQLRRN